MNLCRLSNAEVHKNNGFDRLFRQMMKEEPGLRVGSRVLQRRIFCLFGFSSSLRCYLGEGIYRSHDGDALYAADVDRAAPG